MEKDSSAQRSRRRELETLVLQRVQEVSPAIAAAKHVDEVILAVNSLALLLFPIDVSLVSDCLDERYRSHVCDTKVPTDAERDEYWHVFYYGAAFPTMARILLYNVASIWLAQFPVSAQKLVYDSFFIKGPPDEILQALVPGLTRNGTNDADHNAVCANIERLLVLCLLENKGVQYMVTSVLVANNSGENVLQLIKPRDLTFISMLAQTLASIPDKARVKASSVLSSQSKFFQQVVIQLMDGAAERAINFPHRADALDEPTTDSAFLFVGETFSRICRRGSTDILVAELIPRLLKHAQQCPLLDGDFTALDLVQSQPETLFWLKIMETIRDQYTVERLSDSLLRQLSRRNTSDREAFLTLWLLFSQLFKHHIGMRSMFIDKFLFAKVFPICCLRWILQISVFNSSPYADIHMDQKREGFLDIVHRLASTWSRREFTQSVAIEQQAYITAALGFCLERMTKRELESTKDVLHSILQGVSCRLESPIHLVRKMASSIALVFSKVVDPKNPLYLDDEHSETVDWEFGLIPLRNEVGTSFPANRDDKNGSKSSSSRKKRHNDHGKGKNVKGDFVRDDSKFSRFSDPDKIIDPALINSGTLYNNEDEEEEDDDSKNSEASSDSSLQPYDLTDDDSDLQRKISQIGEICAALRKPDDADGVESALNAAERLVRASPDELCHSAGDLVRALVHVRCSDIAIEGEEDSAEDKRQKALVALLVTSPFESLDAVTKLLYSPNVDASQRILIIDVMTDAALELADSKIMRVGHDRRNLISTVSGTQPWFIPSSKGPSGAGPWKEILETGTSLNWSHRYERELPSRPGQLKMGKSRRWSIRTAKDNIQEWSKNKFPLYAAAFMFPAIQEFDKVRHGVDLLNRDFIVLGKLIYMLGVCMKCVAMHPEASALAPSLLDMLRRREISHHAEAFVRRSVIFTASCIVAALHPSFVASALIEGNDEISNGLEWIRTLALHVAEHDPDTECSTMAMKCLQLHAEMALQTSRSLESADCFRTKASALPSKTNDIIIPSSSMKLQL
ncbi:telomere length regulation protein [Dioscorea alata]|uniref:Telomere length regulation protein n=1 Tax=Dioscorea alata TaxID=55571 RepID=A0ACB7W0L6_DIOAL|nr:telomere length regulation protein [Dioscorea alata]